MPKRCKDGLKMAIFDEFEAIKRIKIERVKNPENGQNKGFAIKMLSE